MSSMHEAAYRRLVAVAVLGAFALPVAAQPDGHLRAEHWFDFETVSDPQIAPYGLHIVYVRGYNDIMTDRSNSNLWLVDVMGNRHRPLTTGKQSDSSPRWSHDGTRIAFVSDREAGSQIFVLLVGDRQLVRVTNTPESPANLAWSPDDSQIAFTMSVPGEAPEGVQMPKKPEGAEWADPPIVIDKLIYRFNKRGYLPNKYRHIFVVPSLGGTPRQLTDGEYDHDAPSWAADGSKLYFSATRKPDADWIVQNSEIYSVTLDGRIEVLTDRRGPDDDPIVSPDGKSIAYIGFDEKGLSYTIRRLHVLDLENLQSKCLTADLDRSVSGVTWGPDSEHIYFGVRDSGNQNIHVAGIVDGVKPLTLGAHQLRGLSMAKSELRRTRVRIMQEREQEPGAILIPLHEPGDEPWSPDRRQTERRSNLELEKDIDRLLPETEERPDASLGQAEPNRKPPSQEELDRMVENFRTRFAAVRSDPSSPGEIVTFNLSDLTPKRLTHVNDDILNHRKLGRVEEIRYKSSFDQRDIQGWIVYPPDFDPVQKYPLILYIHGGPHAMYGVNFSFEFQVHAANGYVVFYCNPRGSTGYGEEFGNVIQYNYPGDDYFDLMSGVDEVVKRGFIDERNMFVTGGSGGGVLTCWVIGRNDRFAAAASQYPVINWYSFVLTCDITPYVHKRWFRGYPWEDLEGHMKRSPISLVGNVTTPTLLITGEVDWRTPISEMEQYYQALRLQKKEAKMVRIPDEAHGVHARPSHYIAKILHIQEWFESHKRGQPDRGD